MSTLRCITSVRYVQWSHCKWSLRCSRQAYSRADREQITEWLLVTSERWGGLQVCVELEEKYGRHTAGSYQTHLRDNLNRNNNYAAAVYSRYINSEQDRNRAGAEAKSRAETLMKAHNLTSTPSRSSADAMRGAPQVRSGAVEAEDEDEIVPPTQPTQPVAPPSKATSPITPVASVLALGSPAAERLPLLEQHLEGAQSALKPQNRTSASQYAGNAPETPAVPAKFGETEKKYLVDRLADMFSNELQEDINLDSDALDKADLPALKPPARLWAELHAKVRDVHLTHTSAVALG